MDYNIILNTLGMYKDIKTYKFDCFYVFELTDNVVGSYENIGIIPILRNLIKGISFINRREEPYKSILDKYEKLIEGYRNYPFSNSCTIGNFIWISKDVFFSDVRFRLSDAECTVPLSEALARLLGVFDIDNSVLDILRRS